MVVDGIQDVIKRALLRFNSIAQVDEADVQALPGLCTPQSPFFQSVGEIDKIDLGLYISNTYIKEAVDTAQRINRLNFWELSLMDRAFYISLCYDSPAFDMRRRAIANLPIASKSIASMRQLANVHQIFMTRGIADDCVIQALLQAYDNLV